MLSTFRTLLKMTAAGLLAGALLASSATPAAAAPITYEFTLNTGAIAGLSGTLALGFSSYGADATGSITSFNAYDATLGAGPLPGPVAFNSGSTVTQGITYGHQLSFLATMDVTASAIPPAFPEAAGASITVSTNLPDLGLYSGAITFFFPVTGEPSALVIPGPNGEPALPFTFTEATPVPEPTTLLLVASGAAAIVLRRRQAKA